MKKLLHSFILVLLLVVQLSAQEKTDGTVTDLSAPAQTVGTEAAARKPKDPTGGLDPFTKDIFDIGSKIAGIFSFIVAIIVAVHQINKYSEERISQSKEDREQRQKELEEIQLNAKINRARFWLELRRMFADHNDVHVKLRSDGEWSHPNSGPSSKDEWAQIEAYMGLFEHCQKMLDDGLIDLVTFKSVYGYRVENILSNRIIVTEKLLKRRKDWTVFRELVERLGLMYMIDETFDFLPSAWAKAPAETRAYHPGTSFSTAKLIRIEKSCSQAVIR